MSKATPVGVRLQPKLRDRAAADAAALDRPKSGVTDQAAKVFVDGRQWQLAAIDKDIRAADAARLVAHEDVVAWVASWDGPDELPIPEWE